MVTLYCTSKMKGAAEIIETLSTRLDSRATDRQSNCEVLLRLKKVSDKMAKIPKKIELPTNDYSGYQIIWHQIGS